MTSDPPTETTLRFDRGTVLCDGLSAAAALPPESPLVWDPRVRRFRVEAATWPDVAASLRAAGRAVRERVLDPLPTAVWRAVSLRPYQHAALSAWQLGSARGIVVLPTGAGKTRLALAAMAARAGAALIVVPTRVLLHQWRREAAAFYPGPIGALGDGREELRGVTVATFDSARRAMPGIGHRFATLVVDEAHHFGNGGWDDLLRMCAAPHRLGLTATPPHGLAALRLAALVGPVCFALRAGDLAGGYLADLELVEWPLDLTKAERQEYEAAREVFLARWQLFCATAPGSAWDSFVAACRQSEAGRQALRGWHRARQVASWTAAKSHAVGRLLAHHSDARMLIFTHDKRAAYAIASTHWLMPITSDISRGEREWALAAFCRGDLRALVSARVLNEGVDVPEAEVGIVVGSSGGAREYVQRVGRVLRPRVGKRAIVYELVSSDTTEVSQAQRRRDALDPGRHGAVRGR